MRRIVEGASRLPQATIGEWFCNFVVAHPRGFEPLASAFGGQRFRQLWTVTVAQCV